MTAVLTEKLQTHPVVRRTLHCGSPIDIWVSPVHPKLYDYLPSCSLPHLGKKATTLGVPLIPWSAHSLHSTDQEALLLCLQNTLQILPPTCQWCSAGQCHLSTVLGQGPFLIPPLFSYHLVFAQSQGELFILSFIKIFQWVLISFRIKSNSLTWPEAFLISNLQLSLAFCPLPNSAVTSLAIIQHTGLISVPGPWSLLSLLLEALSFQIFSGSSPSSIQVLAQMSLLWGAPVSTFSILF